MEKPIYKLEFTRTEIMILLVLTATLVTIFYHVFIISREHSRQRICLNNIRKIAVAIQMYVHDHNDRYPIYPWTTNISPYLENDLKTFFCPDDINTSTVPICSYGYNGSLMNLDKNKLSTLYVVNPAAVGLICDATPTRPVSQAGYIPGAALLPDQLASVVPMARHNGGVVMAFCDGHTQWVPGEFNPADAGNPVTKGFYGCASFNLVSNGFTGGLPASDALTETDYDYPHPYGFHVGGERATDMLVYTMASLWEFKGKSSGVIGAEFVPCSPTIFSPSVTTLKYAQSHYKNYIWGTVDSTGDRVIGHDALVIIVAKNTQIQPNTIGGLTSIRNISQPNNGWYCCSTATVAAWFTENGGVSSGNWQAYTYNDNWENATIGQIARYLHLPTSKGCPTGFGMKCWRVGTDWDMVAAVAGDPHGIGYCSSSVADPDRVQCLGIYDPTSSNGPASGQYYWPNADAKHRTCLPNPYPGRGPNSHIPYQWPPALVRSLKVVSAGEGTRLVKDIMKGNKLAHSPLFAFSYW